MNSTRCARRSASSASRCSVSRTAPKLAMAYALLHPAHVERLLVDSVERTDLPDPRDLDFYRDLPGILAAYCPGRLCRAATPSFPADVFALANRMAAEPV